ncbi:MAG: inositol monophosphatase family protein, partial [Planctomycetota bacterium]
MSEARSRQAFSARDLEQVVSAARRAGGELLRLFRLPPEELEVGFKGPRDLVTSADRTSESILIEELRRCFPGDAMLSEERATEVAWGD